MSKAFRRQSRAHGQWPRRNSMSQSMCHVWKHQKKLHFRAWHPGNRCRKTRGHSRSQFEFAKTECHNAFARNSHHAATNIKQALIDKTINEALAEGMRQQRNGGNDRDIGKVASKVDGIKTERRAPIVWREMRGSSPARSFHNAKAGIMGMGITIRHDIFHDSTIIGLEGDSIKHDIRPLIGELSDPALLRLRDLFSNTHGFDVGDNNIYSAVKALAFENCFNPVADMIDSAQAGWDKHPRPDKMATAYLSAEDTELNRLVIRKHMIAAVRRVRQPGCQYQIMVVLNPMKAGTNRQPSGPSPALRIFRTKTSSPRVARKPWSCCTRSGITNAQS